MGWQVSDDERVPHASLTAKQSVTHGSPLATGFTTLAISANTLYGIPFFVPVTMTVLSLGFEVTTTAAGNARLGIYRDNGGVPGALVIDAGTVSVSTSGGKSISISQSLTPGWYWLALVSDVAPGLRANSQTQGLHLLGFTSNTDVTVHLGVSVAFTYAALPDPFTAGSTLMTTAVPRLMLGT